MNMKTLFKSFLLLFCMLSFLQYANAVPAYPHPIEYKQPDGSVITITLKGDERIHWAVSTDDYTLLLNKNGFYEYAIKDATGDLVLSGVHARNEKERTQEEKMLLQQTPKKLHFNVSQVKEAKALRAARNPQQPLSKMIDKQQTPFIGEKRVPVILVDFPGKPFTKAKAEYETLMNQIGYSQGSATGSVRDYFLASSYNQLDFQAEVYGPYTLSRSIAYYDDSSWGDPRVMAYEAILAACNNGLDLSAYDLDNDGIIDGVHIIFAGYGQEAGAPAGQSIWSHMWYAELYGLGGKQGTIYSCTPELRGTSGSTLAPMGTVAHELSHVFGLPDLYDTDYWDSGGYTEAIEQWDIMAFGSWNNNGDTPSYHSAWCKDFLGWVTAIELTEPAEITLPDPAKQGVIYRINTQTPNEYFLLENRQRQGWDAYLPGKGMLIYHVDENHPGWVDNTINVNPQKPGLYIKAAYGDCYEGAPYPNSGNAKFSDTSTPNSKSWAGKNTEKPVTYIAQNGNGTISFKFMLGNDGDDCQHGTKGNISWKLCGETLTISGSGKIPDWAWESNNNIKEVIIEEGITSIGYGAFFECCNLTSINISNSVVSIGSYVFAVCENLQSITLGKSVASIGDNAFMYCESLTEFIISEENQHFSFSDGVLFDKNKETLIVCLIKQSSNYVIPNTVKTIAGGAFFNSQLTSITIPNSVISIGYRAFGNSNLISVDIPNSVVSIGESAFYGCYFLNTISVGKGVSSIGRDAFANCPNVSKLIVSEDNPYYSALNGVLFDKQKERLISYIVRNSSHYTVPNTVKIIEECSFVRCYNLNYIIIPNSVTTIGDYAFQLCGNLKSIYLGNSVSYIGAYALSFTGLETVIFPDLVTDISGQVLWNCLNLKSVTLGCNTDILEFGAFWNCSNLQEIISLNTFPPQVDDYFGMDAFIGVNKSACTLYIPKGSLSLYQKAAGWQGFKTIIELEGPDPDPLTWTFDSSTGTLTISGTIPMMNFLSPEENYENYAPWYAHKSQIKQVKIEKGVKNIGKSAFYNCNNLVSISIPESIIRIGEEAFYNCSSLSSVTIPNGVRNIEDAAFFNCHSLSSIIIPNSVASIGEQAFANCYRMGDYNLQSMTVKWLTPLKEVDRAFRMTSVGGITLIVPAGTKALYEVAPVWKHFGKIVESEPTDVSNVSLNKTTVFLKDSNLFINSLESETINIYSVNGMLIVSKRKQKGEIMLPIGHIPNQILIVKGSSGWVRKIAK